MSKIEEVTREWEVYADGAPRRIYEEKIGDNIKLTIYPEDRDIVINKSEDGTSYLELSYEEGNKLYEVIRDWFDE